MNRNPGLYRANFQYSNTIIKVTLFIIIMMGSLYSSVYHISAQTSGIQLISATNVPSSAGINEPNFEVCFDEIVPVTYESGSICLSSDESACLPFAIDDALAISDADTGTPLFAVESNTRDISPVEFSTLLSVGENNLRVQIIDLLGPECGGTPLWLVPQGVFEVPPFDLSSLAGFPSWITQVLEPVSLPLGNFVTQHSDLFVTSPGIPFDFARTYNTHTPFDGSLGFGWTHNYNWKLEVNGNIVTVTYPDGRTAQYEEGADGFISPAGDFDTLEQGDSGFILTSVERTQYIFDDNNHLIEIVDRNGNQMLFDYSDDNLTTITDTAGREYTLQYDNGRITTLTDPIGREVNYSFDDDGDLDVVRLAHGGELRYSYDELHRLLTITDPDGQQFVNNTYDEHDRVVMQEDAEGSISELWYANDNSVVVLTDNEGNLTTYQFDEDFRLIQETDMHGYSASYTYDDNHSRTSVIDKGGHETLYSYDEWNNVSSITNSDGLTTFDFEDGIELTNSRDTRNSEIVAEYDDAGNRISLTTALGTTLYQYGNQGLLDVEIDTAGYSTYFDYDEQGNLTRITDPQNHETQFDYDEVGRMLFVTDANQNTTQFSYDNVDRIIEVIDPRGHSTYLTYDLTGNLISLEDRNDSSIAFSYNPNDQLQSIRDREGLYTYFEYDAQYNLTRFIDRRSNETEFYYDEVYNIVTVRDRSGAETHYVYDADQEVVASIDAHGNRTEFQHDDRHRITRIIDAYEQITEIEYDELGQVTSVHDPRGGFTRYSYNAVGLVTSITDSLDGLTRYNYDSRGNLIEVIDPLNQATNYIFDELNQLIQITDALNQSQFMHYDPVGSLSRFVDGRGAETQYIYDENENIIEAIDALSGHMRYEYDNENQLSSLTNPNGNTTLFTYDLRGDLSSVQLPEGQTTHLSYDENQNLIAVTNARGHIMYMSYDERDLLNRVIDPLGNTTSYAYDALAQLTELTDAENHQTRYEYDALGRLTSVTQNFVPDAPFNNIAFPDRNLRTSYTYDPMGALLSITDANGHSQYFTVDLLGRTTNEENARENTWQYIYNAVGNVVERYDAIGNLTEYDFDALNRLTDIRYFDGSEIHYDLDANSNLINMIDQSGQTVMEYDLLNRLTSIIKSSPTMNAETIQRAYDPASNLTSITYPDGRQIQYDYDANEWLSRTKLPHEGTVFYTYNPDGLLTEIEYPNQTITYRDYDAADRLVSLEHYGPQGLFRAYEYSYDRVGNRTQLVETMLGPEPRNVPVVDVSPPEITLPIPIIRVEPGNSGRSDNSSNVITLPQIQSDGATLIPDIDPSATFIPIIADVGDTATQSLTPTLTTITSVTETDIPNTPAVPSPTTDVPTVSPTNTETPTSATTPSETPFPTAVPSETATATATASDTPSPTSVPSSTSTATSTVDPSCPTGGNVIAASAGTIYALTVALDASYANCSIDNAGIYNSLRQKLEAAQSALDSGNLQGAITHLDAYISEVDNHAGSHVELASATLLKNLTEQVKSILLSSASIDDGSKVLSLPETSVNFTIPANALFRHHTNDNSSNNWGRDFPAQSSHGNNGNPQGRPTYERIISYEYDAIYRLTQANYSTGEFFRYSHDLVGNVLSEQTNWNLGPGNNTPPYVSRIFTYNEANQLLTIDDLRFFYDLNGNRIGMYGSERIVTYEYSGENQLVLAQVYDVHRNNIVPDDTVDFIYDGLGRRAESGVIDRGVRKVSQYLYPNFGFVPIVENDTPGQTRNYYLDPLGLRLSMEEIQGNGHGVHYYFHPDAVGSVSAVTNHVGHSIYAYDYAPFGTLRDVNQAENASNRTDPHNHFAFNDVEWEENLGLNDFGSRFYDPGTLSWLGQDSYRGTISDPSSLHRYAFVRNNPVNLADYGGFFDVETGTVQAGDTYWSIAQQVYGDSSLWQRIYEANRYQITGDFLYPGQRLNIPSLRSSSNWADLRVGQTVTYSTQHGPQIRSMCGGTYMCSDRNLPVSMQVSDLVGMCTQYDNPNVSACSKGGYRLLNGSDIVISEIRRVGREMNSHVAIRSFVENVAQEIGTIEQTVRKKIESEYGEYGEDIRLIVGETSIDPSGVGNIVFGYYMAYLNFPRWLEDAISDGAQQFNPRSLADNPMCGIGLANVVAGNQLSLLAYACDFKDNPDDESQRRTGRTLFNLENNPEYINQRLLEGVAMQEGLR